MPTPINDLWMKEPAFSDRIKANRAKAERLGWRHFDVAMFCDPHVLMGVPPEGGEPKRVPDFGAEPTTDRALLLQFLDAFKRAYEEKFDELAWEAFSDVAPSSAEIRDHIASDQEAGVDYRALLAKYIDHVGQCEGAIFLDDVSDVEFTPEEKAALTAAANSTPGPAVADPAPAMPLPIDRLWATPEWEKRINLNTKEALQLGWKDVYVMRTVVPNVLMGLPPNSMTQTTVPDFTFTNYHGE